MGSSALVGNSMKLSEVTPGDMDAFAANVYATLKVTRQESDAKAVYRLGEYIRELTRRLDLQIAEHHVDLHRLAQAVEELKDLKDEKNTVRDL